MPRVSYTKWSGEHVDYVVFDKRDFINRCYSDAEQRNRDGVIYEITTPRALADQFVLDAEDSEEAFADAEAEWVLDLARRFGWDTLLYRADYARAAGEYSDKPISEFDAACAYAAHDVQNFRFEHDADQ